MSDTLQIILALGGSAFITCIVNACFQKIILGTKKKQAYDKEQDLKDIKNIINEAMDPLNNEITAINKKLDRVSEGTQASLRTDILKIYKECAHKGYRNLTDSENFEDMYRAYHKLGGNSFVDETVKPAFNKLKVIDIVETNDHNNK